MQVAHCPACPHCIQFGAAASAVFSGFGRCCETLHHVHTSNVNPNRVLVPQYKNVSAVVNLWAVGKRCQTVGNEGTTVGLYSYAAL